MTATTTLTRAAEWRARAIAEKLPQVQLERWMAAHRDPKWKPKVRRATKPRPVRISKIEFARLAREHELVMVGVDLREITEPVSLEEFLRRKSDSNWKPKARRRATTSLPRLTTSQWAAEEARVRDYVASRGGAV